MNPFIIAFGLSLVPTVALYVVYYQSNEDKIHQMRRQNGDGEGRGVGSMNVSRNGSISAANQQLMSSLYANRQETDLFTAIGEKNRKSATEFIQHTNQQKLGKTEKKKEKNQKSHLPDTTV